jgi:tRNA dimethylallyltransferase
MDWLIAIVGPTAVGKSELAYFVAQKLSGEIVNADSRQVYRYLDIGTAKPSQEIRRIVPHHLIDIIDPDETFTLALYHQLAYPTIESIQRRGKLPLVVGGSGLYLWSVLEGWQIPKVAPDPELRQHLEERAIQEGNQSLYQELQRLDPAAAEKIALTNRRRLIRALEIIQATGHPFSQLKRKEPPPFQPIIIGLTLNRQELYQRIDQRVDEMIQRGLVEEVNGLLARGYQLNCPAMSGLGYKQIGLYLDGKLSLPEAIQRIKFETHRLARYQYTWFSFKDKRINWFNRAETTREEILAFIKRNILDNSLKTAIEI